MEFKRLVVSILIYESRTAGRQTRDGLSSGKRLRSIGRYLQYGVCAEHGTAAVRNQRRHRLLRHISRVTACAAYEELLTDLPSSGSRACVAKLQRSGRSPALEDHGLLLHPCSTIVCAPRRRPPPGRRGSAGRPREPSAPEASAASCRCCSDSDRAGRCSAIAASGLRRSIRSSTLRSRDSFAQMPGFLSYRGYWEGSTTCNWPPPACSWDR